jgi:hypothetical protein
VKEKQGNISMSSFAYLFFQNIPLLITALIPPDVISLGGKENRNGG